MREFKDKPILTKAWFVWLAACCFLLYEMVLRVSPSIMTQELMETFHISSTGLGILVACYYYSYVPLQIPCGILIDYFGPRKIISISAFLCASGSLLFATTSSLLVAMIGRFLIGAGSACAFISCTKIVVNWFPLAHFPLVVGFTNAMGTLGGILGGVPSAFLVNRYGWSSFFKSLFFIGLLVTLSSWFFIQDHPHSEQPEKHEHSSLLDFWSHLKEVFQNPQIWLSGMVGGFMYLPISAFTELWVVPFMVNSHSISNQLASLSGFMIFIGMAIGSIFFAWLAKKIQSVVKVMKISAVASAFLFFLIIFSKHYHLWLSFSFMFFIGFSAGGQVLCFTCARNNAPGHISGTVMAVTNAIIMFSGLVFQPLLGAIIDWVWDGTISEKGICIYNNYCYQIAILTLPIALILTLFLLKWIKEPYRQEDF